MVEEGKICFDGPGQKMPDFDELTVDL